MQKSYDLIVVGTGTASSIVNTCWSAGWQVAVIDHRPFGRILGAHLVGPGTEEVINLFALAIQTRLTALK